MIKCEHSTNEGQHMNVRQKGKISKMDGKHQWLRIRHSRPLPPSSEDLKQFVTEFESCLKPLVGKKQIWRHIDQKGLVMIKCLGNAFLETCFPSLLLELRVWASQ